MRTRPRHAAILSTAASVALLAGCVGQPFPVGAYRSLTDVNGLGPVTMTFNPDGTLLIAQGATRSRGTYSVSGDRITLSDARCRDQEGQETAVYSWLWNGSTLSMSADNDACLSRQLAVRGMEPVG